MRSWSKRQQPQVMPLTPCCLPLTKSLFSLPPRIFAGAAAAGKRLLDLAAKGRIQEAGPLPWRSDKDLQQKLRDGNAALRRWQAEIKRQGESQSQSHGMIGKGERACRSLALHWQYGRCKFLWWCAYLKFAAEPSTYMDLHTCMPACVKETLLESAWYVVLGLLFE